MNLCNIKSISIIIIIVIISIVLYDYLILKRRENFTIDEDGAKKLGIYDAIRILKNIEDKETLKIKNLKINGNAEMDNLKIYKNAEMDNLDVKNKMNSKIITMNNRRIENIISKKIYDEIEKIRDRTSIL